jgi:ATP-binding cassette subfamily B protein
VVRDRARGPVSFALHPPGIYPLKTYLRGVRDVSNSYLRIARLLPSGGAGLVALLIGLNLILGLLPACFVVATSVMIGRVPAAVAGGVGSAEWTSLVAAFMVAAAAFIGQQIVAPLQFALGEMLARRIDGHVSGRLIAAALKSTGIGPLEDQNLLDDLSEAVHALELTRTAGFACAGLVALIARYTQLVSCAVLVAFFFSWPAALGLFAVTMVFRRGQRGGMRTYSRLFAKDIGARRTARYYRSVVLRPEAAKEIRVFGLADWLSEHYRTRQMALMMRVWAERRRIYFGPYVVYTAFGLAVTGIALAAMGRAAATGAISLTQLTLGLQAALAMNRLGEYFPEADTQTQFGMIAYDGVEGFERGIAAFDDRTVRLEPHRDPEGLPRREIRFEKVSFRYPGSDRAVLDEIELSLPAGQCTAIVGLNGAGKTTLVKLLARLYEPTGGRILVDGLDTRSFGVAEWRRRIGVIFQDFNRYELTAAENIGFGAIELAGNRDRIRAAARQAGILSTLERLPRGLDTPLARQYKDGAELSGGQWQRVAIARALFALENGASILVLDEPTAALDVRAEAAFFDKFVDVTRGATALLISHRFSSVRHADRIVVMAGGKVIEQGSHEDLLARNGRYAELFRLQADRFAEDEEEAEQVDAADLVGDSGEAADAAEAGAAEWAAASAPEPAT